MISRTFGAPFGGTTCAGQQGLESLALRLITPPNSGGWAGSVFPPMVVVALGEHRSPPVCWANVPVAAKVPSKRAASVKLYTQTGQRLFDLRGPPNDLK